LQDFQGAVPQAVGGIQRTDWSLEVRLPTILWIL